MTVVSVTIVSRLSMFGVGSLVCCAVTLVVLGMVLEGAYGSESD